MTTEQNIFWKAKCLYGINSHVQSVQMDGISLDRIKSLTRLSQILFLIQILFRI